MNTDLFTRQKVYACVDQRPSTLKNQRVQKFITKHFSENSDDSHLLEQRRSACEQFSQSQGDRVLFSRIERERSTTIVLAQECDEKVKSDEHESNPEGRFL